MIGRELPSYELKLIRANEHRDAVIKALAACAYGECEIIPEEDPEGKIIVMRVRLPKPSSSISVLIGDFLFNVRASLDHMVCALVESNPPHVPIKRNMFPICSSPESFAEQIRGHRLDGVPDKAQTLIEGLQPYPTRKNPLRRMADLHEIDKHRMLNLVTAVARDTHVDWSKGSETFLSLFLGGEELRDGAIFGDIGVPLDRPDFPDIRKRFSNVKVQGHAALFVAFDDPAVERLETLRVDRVLQEISEFMWETVFPTFEPFLH